MPDLEYKLGNMDPPDLSGMDEGRFIVERDTKSSLTIHARCGKHGHEEMVKALNLDEKSVYGGGYYYTFDDTLSFMSHSMEYGSVPNEAAEEFCKKLKDYLNEHGRNIEDTHVDMFPIDEDDGNRDKWIELGFRLDDVT